MGNQRKQLQTVHKSILVRPNDPRILLEKVWDKAEPSADEFEKTVIATIITHGVQAYKKIKWLESQHFRIQECRIIYSVIEQMSKSGSVIDLLTLIEVMKRKGALMKAGGPAVVAEISGHAARLPNIQDHANFILDASLQREAADMALKLYVDIFEGKSDVYHLRNKFAEKVKVVPPSSYFTAQSMNEAMDEGEKAPPIKQLAGELWGTGEVTFLFSEPGLGKTIFCVQLTDNITRGKGTFGKILKNECGARTILYYDFELLVQEIFKRYSNDAGEKYIFDEKRFIRMKENYNFKNRRRRGNNDIIDYIIDDIERLEADGVVIDNITYLSAESSHDTEVAMNLMRSIKDYNKSTAFPFLILGHTSKRVNNTLPVTQGDMSGSAHFARFATNLVAICRSATDKKLRYIKQVKKRNGEETFHEDNVIVCSIKKDAEGKMLRYVYEYLDEEQNHLASWTKEDDVDDLLEEACVQRADTGIGWRKVAENIGFKGSKNTLEKKAKGFARKNMNWDIDPVSKKIVRAKVIMKVGDKQVHGPANPLPIPAPKKEITASVKTENKEGYTDLPY